MMRGMYECRPLAKREHTLGRWRATTWLRQALKQACQSDATERCSKTEPNTPDHVEQAEQPVPILDERQALEAERRERGIAPEEAYGKKQPPVGMHQEALGDEYQEETNNKAS